jgi:UDP:flavonoid glycosyltransferase YjiC (YdhE family)
VFNDAPETFRAIIDGLAGEDLDLVATLGKNGDPDCFGPQPPNVHLERYVPQTLLLPLCDAVICHAGYGTIMGAATNGLPMLCMPRSADQCFGAQRCADLGLGLSLATHHLPGELYPFCGPGDIDAEKVRQAVRSLLDDPKHRVAAERVKAECETMPDVHHAVALVEELVVGRG